MCERILIEAGLKTRLHAYGTNIEGEWDAVFGAIKRCHEAIHAMGVPRISTNLRLGTRTDRELIRRVIRSGENHGEAFWELPLVEEYRDALKTPYADINNIASGGLAGAITASLFLREFVPKGVAWAHLDIAGPMFKEKDWKYYEAGALGFGLKTLVDLSERFHDPVP